MFSTLISMTILTFFVFFRLVCLFFSWHNSKIQLQEKRTKIMRNQCNPKGNQECFLQSRDQQQQQVLKRLWMSTYLYLLSVYLIFYQ